MGRLTTPPGGGHDIRIGDRLCEVRRSWLSQSQRHAGGGFPVIAPTGTPAAMQAMDLTLHHQRWIREIRVPIDRLDVMLEPDFSGRRCSRCATTLPYGTGKTPPLICTGLPKI